MKVPGFTAEVSLYQMNERYYIAGTHQTLANGREVLPQMRGNFWCYDDCIDAGGDIWRCRAKCDRQETFFPWKHFGI